MNEFLKLILSELHGAVGAAAVAAVLCVAAVCASAGIYYAVYHGERKFPLGRAVSAALLVCWAAAVLYLTVLRSPYGGGMNLHLFRAWREAWNSFSFQNWSNVLLNVAMFVPLGVLLPLAVKFFRRPAASCGAFLISTLSIELLQLIFSVGLFDVDDIFANFVGAAFGYGAVTAVIALSEKRFARATAFASAPLAVLAAVGGIFAAYYIKPYGNLACAPSYRADAGGVRWSASCELSGDASSVPIYRAKPRDKDACVAAGVEFFASLGVGRDEVDTVFYDDFVWMSDHRGPSMEIHYRDGRRVIRVGSGEPAEVDRESAEALLSEYGIEIPDGASFSEDGDGSYTFRLERNGESGRAGWLRARFVLDGGEVTVGTVNDSICEYAYVRDESIISPAEAFSRLQKGEFDGGAFESLRPKRAELISCSLAFEADTKGFFQPVWELAVSIDGGDALKIEIPALA